MVGKGIAPLTATPESRDRVRAIEALSEETGSKQVIRPKS